MRTSNHQTLISGLQMWLNLKPYSIRKYGPKTVHYTLGISNPENGFDQKRNLIVLKPGHHIAVNVQPKVVQTSKAFDGLGTDLRKCKLNHETSGFQFLKQYTRKGCEFECAIQNAISVCHCLPWFLPNNMTGHSTCDMFGGKCFDIIMSDETWYKKCSTSCLEDCQEVVLSTQQSNFPLDMDDICGRGSFLDLHVEHSFRQHFAFEGYKTLVESRSLPDLVKSFSNGSLCKEFVTSFLVFVSIESPTTSVIKSKRESYMVTFNDQMGTIGGTLGLFTGMSVLSMAEVIFFLILLASTGVQSIRKTKIEAVIGEKSETNASNSSQVKENVQAFGKEDLRKVYVIS